MSLNDDDQRDSHEHDVVMPGFRFHPTEEELIDFYLRRKVQGKRFNIELITFLDLYRHDPWELPALAAIGEKEWYFYVPRDRKYRNGDRPNRVTTSGYWKATGADRMIRTEDCRAIGLKKTLVFYAGKAPKGIRTSWIMNEYRLPHHETEQYQKAEISLCRVYKRAGVEDHCHLPSSLSSSKASSSKGTLESKKNFQSLTIQNSLPSDMEQTQDASSMSSTANTRTALGLSSSHHRRGKNSLLDAAISIPITSTGAASSMEVEAGPVMQIRSPFPPPSCIPMIANDEFHRSIAEYQQIYPQNASQFMPPSASHQPLLGLNTLPSLLTSVSDKLWEWNPIADASSRDYSSFI